MTARTCSERRIRRKLGLCRGSAVALLMVSGVCLSACNSSDSASATQPLSQDQGAALLRDVRTNPSRTQSLTLAERRYLAGAIKKEEPKK